MGWRDRITNELIQERTQYLPLGTEDAEDQGGQDIHLKRQISKLLGKNLKPALNKTQWKTKRDLEKVRDNGATRGKEIGNHLRFAIQG